jgi:hypothetical protein
MRQNPFAAPKMEKNEWKEREKKGTEPAAALVREKFGCGERGVREGAVLLCCWTKKKRVSVLGSCR